MAVQSTSRTPFRGVFEATVKSAMKALKRQSLGRRITYCYLLCRRPVELQTNNIHQFLTDDLVVDFQTHREEWPLGRKIEAVTGSDGLVRVVHEV